MGHLRSNPMTKFYVRQQRKFIASATASWRELLSSESPVILSTSCIIVCKNLIEWSITDIFAWRLIGTVPSCMLTSDYISLISYKRWTTLDAICVVRTGRVKKTLELIYCLKTGNIYEKLCQWCGRTFEMICHRICSLDLKSQYLSIFGLSLGHWDQSYLHIHYENPFSCCIANQFFLIQNLMIESLDTVIHDRSHIRVASAT